MGTQSTFLQAVISTFIGLCCAVGVHPQGPEIACKFKPAILHAEVHFDHGNVFAEEGDKATVVCNPGYKTKGREKTFRIVCNKDGEWTKIDGAPLDSSRQCPMPPTVPDAVYRYSSYTPGDPLSGAVAEGAKVEYICLDGYVLVDRMKSYLSCVDGQWEGPIPTCVRSMSCQPPATIYKGLWTLKTGQKVGDKFTVGSEVQYSCKAGYKLIGAETLECTSFPSWSKVAPMCLLETEPNFYCTQLSTINNGYCKCEGEENNSLDMCKPFYRSIQVRCICDRGYKLMGESLLTCAQFGEREKGAWDHEMPYCEEEDLDDMAPSLGGGRSDQGLHITDEGGTHVSTLVVVIATACSVLGVLLLIMVIVIFRRKKPRPRLFHPSVTPPPYSRVTNNILDEHDRLALMAYADATRVHLPTYEEAVQTGRGGNSNSSSRTNTPMPAGDYRPLPSIPPNLRAPSSVPSGGADNPNRHSTVTTSTINRDGLSENFGSLDTVNVSVSDASTSVTVETFDSGTSTRSMASQRATAGSIGSSDDNLANDNAPLLDNNGENCDDTTSDCPTPGQDQKEE
ncbi:hypothetical protein BaRGS_00028380 [Batillaria attramentaria]|uniref:Sushi domain-containing protein n=1 Tax=Batillaria attramentaria TaxID=370345 RepID=A0ABD0JZK6_9CAEN